MTKKARVAVKEILRYFYLTSYQIRLLIGLSATVARWGPPGRIASIFLDNFILMCFAMELRSSSLQIHRLVVGHSTGVVLGGNGIRCTGTLHISSGVVFGRRYEDVPRPGDLHQSPDFFSIQGNLTVGANSVLLGPLNIKGPVIIGAMSLVTKDILEPGVYVGVPVRKIRDLK